MSPDDRPPITHSSVHLNESIPRGFSGNSYRFDRQYRRLTPRQSSAVPWLVDLGVLSIIPAILIGLSVLPESVRIDLALAYMEPTVLNAFTAHYVHFEPVHLLTNVAAYCLVVPLAYVLSVQSGRRTEFFVAFVTFVVVFPFALSALNIALVRPRVGYGFSGIATAFFGFLPVALFAFLSSNLDTGVTQRDSPVVFFGTASIIAIFAVPTSEASAIIALCGAVIAFVYLQEVVSRFSFVWRRWRIAWQVRTERTGIGVLGIGVIVAFPLLVVPATPASGGEIVNTYVHLLGYALGFISSYVTFALVGIDTTT